MGFRKSSSSSLRGPVACAVATLAASLTLAACGSGGSGSNSNAAGGGSNCNGFPKKDIHLVVPFNAGGGYDAWARLIAPYLKDNLGGKVDVVVDDVPGGAGVRGTNQVFMSKPDGTQFVIQAPNDMVGLQILGKTPSGFQFSKMTVIGGVTQDPQVILVAADSPVKNMQDLAALPQPVSDAATEVSAVELLTYDAYGVKAKYILNEGTSDAVLAVRRGDATVTTGSLASVADFMKNGVLKPILFIGKEKITPDLPAYDSIKDAPTAAGTGHPELNDVLEQHRVIAGPPKLPSCITNAMDKALQASLKDPKLLAKAKDAGLNVVPENAAEAQKTTDTIEKQLTAKADVLKAGLPG